MITGTGGNHRHSCVTGTAGSHGHSWGPQTWLLGASMSVEGYGHNFEVYIATTWLLVQPYSVEWSEKYLLL